jgi:hypothetical protein
MDKPKFRVNMPILPVQDALSDANSWADAPITNIQCPLCKDLYQHLHKPQMIDGNDNYEAGWPGRGDLVVVPIDGECGHNWELCIGFHKGFAGIFARLPEGSHSSQ